MNKSVINLAISATSGLLVGSAASYFITKAVLKRKFEMQLHREIEEVREYWSRLNDEGVTLPQSVIDEIENTDPDRTQEMIERGRRLIEARDLGYTGLEETVESLEERESIVVFETDIEEGAVAVEYETEGHPAEVEYEKETRSITIEEATPIDYDGDEFKSFVARRNPSQAYVISVDEFDERPEFEKTTMTFFAGDNTLMDQAEKIHNDSGALLGPDALENFGKFSKDEHIVYVRNERLSMDFEIIRDDQKYTDVILHGMLEGD